jgi:hypothetical protein
VQVTVVLPSGPVPPRTSGGGVLRGFRVAVVPARWRVVVRGAALFQRRPVEHGYPR